MAAWKIVVSGVLAVCVGGCSSVGYYWQSLAGQWQMLQRRAPVDALLQAPDTPPALRARLVKALDIRRFASEALALPDNNSYRSYADVRRPFVVWNVFVAPVDALQLREWCFPVAGCVGYRGYFSESQARAFAAQQEAQGLDVYVAGVAAYSTLGWFDDPLLNTVIHRSDAQLAGLIFHELAHQRLYVKDDTAFNEGFATAVELEGVRRWLAQGALPDEAERYAVARRRQEAFVALVGEARERLVRAYEASDAAVKRREKQAVQAWLRARYVELKTAWGDHDGYDAWFAGPLNNAQLGAVAAYRDDAPLFQGVLASVGGDFQAFYAQATDISRLPKGERRAALRAQALSAGRAASPTIQAPLP